MIPLREINEDKLRAEEQKVIEEAVGKELERRLADYEAGISKAIPADKAHQYIRSILKS
ncbi:MAG: hypothetical protein C4527_24045 [Candidatus Omnitrophota bacterium]|jgi:putative addiction module component (TIGR02574 family)|nr:MAG: hypothetical protein C4527_24045 [Candidatus Omnitrophota bacterium]